VAPYLVHLTTDEQRKRWLPDFCSGELLTAIGMTEPSGGSDLAALRTTAVRDGDHWVINGSKTFITNGYSADLVVVAARTAPEKKARGITLFGVRSDTPGFSRGRKLDKVGQDESDTAELAFEDVRVTDDDVIGELDEGFIHMMTWLPQERLGSAITNLAHGRQILDETIEYAKQRQAFGKPIGSFQHNQFLLAELVTRVEVTQAYVDQCVAAHADGKLTAIDAAKAKCRTTCWTTASRCTAATGT
jgi:long-chain-acyl-CoA dehydrogenase